MLKNGQGYYTPFPPSILKHIDKEIKEEVEPHNLHSFKVVTPSFLANEEKFALDRKVWKESLKAQLETALEEPSILFMTAKERGRILPFAYIDSLSHSHDVPGQLIENVYGKDSEQDVEWQQLITAPNTPLSELHKLYSDALRVKVHASIDSRLESRRAISFLTRILSAAAQKQS